jgi:hypothetical protein
MLSSSETALLFGVGVSVDFVEALPSMLQSKMTGWEQDLVTYQL